MGASRNLVFDLEFNYRVVTDLQIWFLHILFVVNSGLHLLCD